MPLTRCLLGRPLGGATHWVLPCDVNNKTLISEGNLKFPGTMGTEKSVETGPMQGRKSGPTVLHCPRLSVTFSKPPRCN